MERTYTVTVNADEIDVTVGDSGEGQPFLILHGGGGPLTVGGFADLLASSRHARAIVPTHPGFGGTARPESLTTIRGLARLYAELLAQLDLTDVVVIGNSIGGWIAPEMALGDTRRIGAIVIVDGVGIEVPGHPIADFSSLTPRQLAERSFHDPDRYGVDPTKLPPEELQVMAGNRAALTVYAGAAMLDPGLGPRLRGVKVPALVVWGEADRIADVAYGRAFAEAIPHAEFVVLKQTGHLPQIESPERLLEAISQFRPASSGEARV